MANLVYVANQGSNTVSVLNGRTNEVIATIPVGTLPIDIVGNPATNRLYVVNQGRRLRKCDPSDYRQCRGYYPRWDGSCGCHYRYIS